MISPSGASQIIVVDTNVWLDYFLGESLHHEDSYAFIVEAQRLNIPLVIPSHSLKDLFFILEQRLKAASDNGNSASSVAKSARSAAWAAVELVMELATVGSTDQSDAWIALKQRALHSDYEDDLVIACAIRLNARLLVTNDHQFIQHSPVTTLCAKDALTLISEEL